MKTYLKTLIGAMSLAVAGSASAISQDGVTWNAGDVNITAGYGAAFFARTLGTAVESGTLAGGINYNMSDSDLYRGAAGIQDTNNPGVGITVGANTSINVGDGIFAFGKIANFGGSSPTNDLFYIFHGASVQSLSGSTISGPKGVVTGAMNPYNILFYSLAPGTITNAMTTACDIGKSVGGAASNCQALLNAAQGGTLFLQLAAVTVPPLNTSSYAQWEVKQNQNCPLTDNSSCGISGRQELSFSEASFNAVGGSAASFFQTQTITVDLTLGVNGDMQQSGSSTMLNGTDVSPVLYNFSLNLQGASIPEPGSLALLGLGLMGAGLVGRRRRQVA